MDKIMDEQIAKFEEVLYSSIEDKTKFDTETQLLDTKYFAYLTKIVAKLLPKLKETFKKISKKLTNVNTKLTELEGRIETLEQSLLSQP